MFLVTFTFQNPQLEFKLSHTFFWTGMKNKRSYFTQFHLFFTLWIKTKMYGHIALLCDLIWPLMDHFCFSSESSKSIFLHLLTWFWITNEPTHPSPFFASIRSLSIGAPFQYGFSILVVQSLFLPIPSHWLVGIGDLPFRISGVVIVLWPIGHTHL